LHEVGVEELVKMHRALQPGDSLRRAAAGLLGKRIISGMRNEWSYRARVESLDALEAEPDEDYVEEFRASATYGPEWDDMIDSADALAGFDSVDDFRDARKVGRLMGGVPSHRPLPSMRAEELNRLQREEQRDLGRTPPFKNFGPL
jgi:hypothetical protein